MQTTYYILTIQSLYITIEIYYFKFQVYQRINPQIKLSDV